jgi:hypothetical protein
MRYALLIQQDETAQVSPDERSARFEAFSRFQQEMYARGVLLGGERLRPSTATTTVRVRDGNLVIADGPFTETKEQVAGFFLIECKDLDEAIEVAAQIPTLDQNTIEVRPVWER